MISGTFCRGDLGGGLDSGKIVGGIDLLRVADLRNVRLLLFSVFIFDLYLMATGFWTVLFTETKTFCEPTVLLFRDVSRQRYNFYYFSRENLTIDMFISMTNNNDKEVDPSEILPI